MLTFFRRLLLVGVITVPFACSEDDGDGNEIGEEGSNTGDSSSATGSGTTGATGGIDIDDDDDNPMMLDGEPCAADVTTAELVEIDIHLMLDSSASMLEELPNGSSKWDAVVDSLTDFVQDPATAGIGVGLQYFPLMRENANLECVIDSDCSGGGGPCSSSACMVQGSVENLNYIAVNGSTTLGVCEGDASCAPGEICRSWLGVCTARDPDSGDDVILYDGDNLLACADGNDCPVGSCDLLGLCEFPDAQGASIICTSLGAPCPTNAGACLLYPYACTNATLCGGEDYSAPAVEISTAADRNDALIASLTAHEPAGLTPTAPALDGVIQHARTRETADPNRKVVAVLATDGLPTVCDPVEIADVSAMARAGVEGTPSVETYVIGVFSEAEAEIAEANLNQIAQAGGTAEAFVITTGNDVATLFLDALNQIRGAALTCDFAIPQPAEGETLDFGQVNLEFVDAAGDSRQLVNVADESACGEAPGTGWYYVRDTDMNQPIQITVCPDVCTEFESAMGASRVNLQIGCETIIK